MKCPKNVLGLTLLAAATAAAATSPNPLGVDYSEWFAAAAQMATDTSGALYLLGYYAVPGGNDASYVTKLSADGKTVLWQNMLGFLTSTMAVSPAGEVFVVQVSQPPDTSVHVAKLGAGGSGMAWTAAAGFSSVGQSFPPPVLAADAKGRAYVAASSPHPGNGFVATVVRLNAAGNAIDYSAQVAGVPTAIAADASGAVVVAGLINGPAGFVTRLAPNGSADYFTTLPQDTSPAALALDAGGNAVVFGQGLLQRLNSVGSVIVSTNVQGGGPPTLGLDAAGNAYVLGVIGQLYPVRNSIATCLPVSSTVTISGAMEETVGTAPILTVVAPDGSIPQITYLPGAAFGSFASNTLLLAMGPNSTVFVATSPLFGFVPTQHGPFPQNFPNETVLLHLAPQSVAQTLSLACVGNSATYFIWPVAPGEIVTLIGTGLGPSQGIQTQASTQSPFPMQVSGVEVTFDGTPAPLLWVQDSQINAIAPWSLTPGTNTQICVSSGGAKTNCLTWPVAQTAPAVFTVDGSHAAALNQDGSLNTAANPAPPGSIVSVFATGLGPINPPQADGAAVGTPLPSNVVQAGVEALWLAVLPPFGLGQVAGPVPVTYAGPAPYLVAGLSQINFQIPPANTAVPDSSRYYLKLPSTTSQAFGIYVAAQ